MKTSKFFIFICLIFMMEKGHCQSVYNTLQAADDELKMVQSLPDAKEKAEVLIKLSKWYYEHITVDTTSIDKAFSSAMTARRIAESLKYTKALLNIYLLLSKINNAKGNFKQSSSDAENALRYAQALKDDNAEGDAYMAQCESGLTGIVDYGEKIKILKKAETAFHKSGDKKREADCEFHMADCYLYLNDHLNTGIKLRLSLKLYQEIRYVHIAYVYDLLGVFYRTMGNYVPAVNDGLLAIKTAEEEKIPLAELGLYYCNLGMTYDAISDYGLTMKYLRKALAFEKAHNNLAGIFQISIYLNQSLSKKGKFLDALKVMTDMTKKYPSIENLYISEYAGCMLNNYRRLGDYKNATTFCKMLEIAKKERFDDLEVLLIAYPKLVPFYAVSGKLKKANQAFKEYYRHVKAMNTPTVWEQYYLIGSFADSVAGNYLGALNNYKQATFLSDSMMETSKMQQINELNILYETVQKDKDLQTVKNESHLKSVIISQSARSRNISFFLAASIMAIAIIIYIGYRRKQKTNILLKQNQEEVARKNETLEKLLKEKEWLVKEIHHRVKNNLHMVEGLLSSQTEFLKNKEALNAIEDSKHRIQAMSMIHQKLYQMDDMSTINMHVYVMELTEHLKYSFKEGNHVLFKLFVADINFPLSYSLPIGLILNEAVTNSMKYAFPHKKGIIEIRLEIKDNFYSLSVKDDGVGLPEGFNAEKCDSLGVTLMNGFSGDIGGTFHMKNGEKGLLIEIMFPVEQCNLLK